MAKRFPEKAEPKKEERKEAMLPPAQRKKAEAKEKAPAFPPKKGAKAPFPFPPKKR